MVVQAVGVHLKMKVVEDEWRGSRDKKKVPLYTTGTICCGFSNYPLGTWLETKCNLDEPQSQLWTILAVNCWECRCNQNVRRTCLSEWRFSEDGYYYRIIFHRLSRLMLPNAFLKSMKIVRNEVFHSKHCSMMLRKVKMWPIPFIIKICNLCEKY